MSNNSRRNRGDPTKEKTYRAQAVMIQPSNSSGAGAGSYSQRMKQSKAPNNSAPNRRSGPPRQSNQAQRQVPNTRQQPPQSKLQRQPPTTRQVPPSRQPPAQQTPHFSQQQRPTRPPPPKMYELQENERFGKVRRVLSGDCLEVQFKEQVGDEVRMVKTQINLDGIRAPRILRNARDEQKHGRSDELFAWESREFLRKIVCHQVVVVKSSSDGGNNKSKGKPTYASVKVRPGDMGNRPITVHDTLLDVAVLSLEKGLSKVKTEVKTPNPEYVAMEVTAQENETGLWAQPDLKGRKNDKSWFRCHHRQVTFNPDLQQFFEENKGKPLQGIVEDVTEGTRVKVEIVFNDQQGIRTSQIIVHLSGVHSPHTGKKPRGREDPEPFGDFARNFTMVRMQHHDVTVTLDVIDKFNNIYGHIDFPKGDIALELIKQGCARVVPWTAHSMGKLDLYLQTEKVAREQKIRMWGEEQFANLPIYGRKGQGAIKEVTSGDSIQILVGDTLKRFYLASIQAPRRNNKNRGGPDPFYAEAKEYVRKQLIGKTVNFVVEYQRQVQNQSNKKGGSDEPFNYITLLYDDNRNLNKELLELGFCKAVRHKKNEPRSVNYNKLLELQKGAEEKEVGVFSPPDKLPKSELDFTATKVRRRNRQRNDEDNHIFNEALAYCEANLGFITREERANQKKPEYRRVPSICEFVFNGERLKVRLTEDNVLCNLILADIRFEKDDKEAGEAKAYCKDLISQMEIEVEIERLDRSARFIGHVFYHDELHGTGEMKNLAEELLKRGWALPLKPRMGPGSKYATTYAKSLAFAKQEKAGRWENYVEPEPEPEKEQRSPRGGDEADGGDDQGQRQQNRKPAGRQRERGGAGRGRGRGRDNRGGDRRDNRGGGRRDNRGGDRGDYARDGDRRRRPRGGQKNVQIDVTVIEDGITFFSREKNSKVAKRIEEAMLKVNPSTTDFPEGWEPARNVVCAGLYNDGKYYRCRVMSTKKDSTLSRVRWIDFGETGTIEQDLLLPIQSEKGKPSLEEIEPLAKRCKLSGLKTPPETTPYFDDAQNYFVQSIRLGKEIKYDMKRDANQFSLVVLKVDGKDLNELMVRNGFARVMRTKDNKNDDYIQHLTQLETDAKARHLGQWEYGDLGSDDEDDRKDGRRGGKSKRGRN